MIAPLLMVVPVAFLPVQTGDDYLKTFLPFLTLDPSSMSFNPDLFYIPPFLAQGSTSANISGQSSCSATSVQSTAINSTAGMDSQGPNSVSDFGPMSKKLADICSVNTSTSAVPQNERQPPLLWGFDESQGLPLTKDSALNNSQGSETHNETSYQSLISRLVDKVTQDMYGASQTKDISEGGEGEGGKNESSQIVGEENSSTIPIEMIPPSLLPYISLTGFPLSKESQGLDKVDGKNMTTQPSAFKGATDSIEVLRRLKNKVSKQRPKSEKSRSPWKGNILQNLSNPPTKSKMAPGKSKTVSGKSNMASGFEANASSLHLSTFHAAQERERRKHMMVVISMVRYQGCH